MQSIVKKIIASIFLILGITIIAGIAYVLYRRANPVWDWKPDPSVIYKDHVFTIKKAESYLLEIAKAREKLTRAIANLAEQKIEMGSLIPLAYASDQYDIVKSLIEKGADINTFSISSVLTYAAFYGDIA